MNRRFIAGFTLFHPFSAGLLTARFEQAKKNARWSEGNSYVVGNLLCA
jgi:hypothetical protein